MDCKAAKANKLNKDIKAGEKVSPFQVFPLRFRMIKQAGKDFELIEEINRLVDFARESL